MFDKSASERIADAIKNDTEILTAPANGWVMYYYGNKNYGGYNVLCKFNKDNTVVVASEIYAKSQTAASHYKVEQSAGVVLSFDETTSISDAQRSTAVVQRSTYYNLKGQRVERPAKGIYVKDGNKVIIK